MHRFRFRMPRRSAAAIDADVDEELRFHFDMRAAELTARRGLDAAAARAEALRQFGDVDDVRRYLRDVDGRRETDTRRREHMADLRQDLFHAARTLRRSPGFAAVVVAALALGIGATTAMFSVVDAMMLRPLAVPQADRLVVFGNPSLVGVTNCCAQRTDNFSHELYRTLRDGARSVTGLVATGYSARLEVGLGESAADATTERARVRLVSGNYFSVLGVRAAAGRAIGVDDDRDGSPGPVAVLSDTYWTRRFARDPRVVGRTITVNRVPVTVVGVAQPGFGGEIAGGLTEMWLPLAAQPQLMPNQNWLRDRNTTWLILLGRLRDGATVAQAGAELTTLARGALASAPDAPADAARATVAARDGRRGIDGMRTEPRLLLVTLLALAGVVLVVVGANVANLLLARAVARRGEIGVRLALGAGRLRVVRHLLAESVLLGALAGAISLVVVIAARAALLRRLEANGDTVPIDLSLHGRVVAFTVLLSLLTAVVLGLVPALRGTRTDLAAALRARARGGVGSAGRRGWRLGTGEWLVVGQVALSLVLLAAAGLFVRTARNLQRVDVGLARDQVLVVGVDAHAAGYAGDRIHQLHRLLTERLQALPGVQAVSFSQNGLYSGIETTGTVQVPGFVAATPEDSSVFTDRVGPGYFGAIGARIVRGRDIEARDDARAARVTVVNETMARFYFKERDPIGQTLRVGDTPYTIVGVASDVKDRSVRSTPVRRHYLAMAQGDGTALVVFAVHASGDPARLTGAARRAVLATDPALRVRAIQPLAALVRESIAPQRVLASIAGTAGALALALTALGLYGVMTYTIVRRTSEFGLRMALGAQPTDVTRLVLRETLSLVAVGAAIGLPAALGAARLLRTQLVGVGVVDPPSLLAAVGVLATVAALAGYRPARRASRASPQGALREE